MKDLYWFSYLFIASIGLNSAASNSFQCSSYCKESWNKFDYRNEFSYFYKYQGEIITTISEVGAYNKVFINSDVQISVLSPCDYVMQLSNIQYGESYTNKSHNIYYKSNTENIENDLSKDHLYFSFQNGKIDTICPTNENNHILQIKKGVLSAFQNSLASFESGGVVYETDVAGICSTQYQVEQYNDNFIIKKTKNLNTCTHRKSQHTSWSATPYSKASPKSNYLLRSVQSCTQIVNQDLVLESTECFETHLFKPFSNGENGAITNLTQKLKLVTIVNDIPKLKLANNYRYESLLSNYKNDAKQANYELSIITEILIDLEKNTKEGVESDVSKLFSRAVKELRYLDKKTIIKLFDQVGKFPKQKNFLLDAISLVATAESITAMRILYEEEIITESHVNAWISSLLLSAEVSLPILESFTPLLRLNNSIKYKAILSGSTLLHMYCKTDPDCYNKKEVQEITEIVQEPLRKTCVPNGFRNHQEILLALKGIGNIGFPSSVNLLRKCFMNNDSPLEIRLAAIAAHRRVNCAENDNLEQLLNYFGQINQNVEIRIASYLAIMQCASYSTIAQIKDVLRHEETNQVGSFVWTHLTNLQESSSRWKQNIKSLVENEFLRNKFSTDVRKYSRNYEMSTFLDSINAGATVESNVVFTSESYLPKSLMLNFTLDLFGETVNIFEAGVRMEGFEQIIENLFGPEGYFPEESIKNMLESIKNKENKTDGYIKKFQNIFASRTTLKEPSALFYTKVFGNENFYTHFRDIEGLVNKTVSERSILERLMKLMSQQSVDYTKAFVFLDSNFKVPTLLGFPLELSVNGTTVLGLTLNEKINLKDFSVHKIHLEGKIHPSVALEIVGSMTVDCFDKKIGLTSINTVNSNTYIDGHIFIDKGRVIDVKVNVPKEEVNIIKVKSQVYFINGNNVSLNRKITDNVEDWKKCTGTSFSNVTGLQICYNLMYVNASELPNAPFFPLTGEFECSMGIKKIDVFNSYQFNFKADADNSNHRPKYKMSMHFDTPNSIVDRNIKTYYMLDCEKLSFNASLQSPFLNYDIHTKIGDDFDNVAFLLQTKLNNNQMVLAQIVLKSSKFDNTWSYKPLAILRYKSENIGTLSGQIDYIENIKYRADLKIESILNDFIKITGDLKLHSKEMNLIARIESSNLNGAARAVITKTQEALSMVANLTYQFEELKPEMINLAFDQYSFRKPNQNTDGLYISANFTQYSHYNTLFLVKTQRSKLYFENKVLATLFKQSWETHQLFKFFRSNGNTDVALRCTLKGVQKKIDYIFNFLYLNCNHKFKVHILTQSNKIQRLESLIDYAGEAEKQNKTFNLLLYYPQHALVFNGLFNQVEEEATDFFIDGYYENEEEKMPLIVIEGKYLNSTLFRFENHTIAGTIQIYESKTSLCTPWIFSSSIQISPDLYISISQLKIYEKFYILHTTWSSNSLSALLQNNEKQIFAVSYLKNLNEFSLLVGFNIFQHFELSLKMTTPYKDFAFLLYWDKSRDVNQKVSLTINSQVNKGLYLVKIEYPNQRIAASFIILPVQVIMNVTWGLDLSQRIYLKAGNKVYDIGGLWFAKLETPFRYLESQEIKLSYYIIPNNAELKLDVNWSQTEINLILSGSKSPGKVSGYLDVNTTIPEISKICIAGSHASSLKDGQSRIKSDATFILNHHQIISQLFWESNGTNISSNFEVVSPSNTIFPITGLLIVSNSQATKYMKSFVNWNGNVISVDYKFKNSESYVILKTPIEGLEVTEAAYTLIEEDRSVLLQVKVNALNQMNYARLSWNSEDKFNMINFEVICPMIGVYKIIFKHSTVFGHLDELFIITQGTDHDILNVILQGELTPLIFLNINVGVKFLEHKATAVVKNSGNPVSSSVQLIWNENYITNTLEIAKHTKYINSFIWNLNSSFLEENVTLKYDQTEDTYLLMGNLHQDLKFNGRVQFHDYLKAVEVALSFTFLPENFFLKYHHKLTQGYFDNHLFLDFNQSVSKFLFNYSKNRTNNLIDKASFMILSPWNHELLVNFSMPCKNTTTVYPKILIKYLNGTIVHIKSKLQFEDLNHNFKIFVNSKYIVPTVIHFKSNLLNSQKSYNLVVKENIENNFSLPSKKEYSTFIDTSLSYNFVDIMRVLTININFPKFLQKLKLEANLNSISQSGKFALDSTILDFEKVFANYSVKLTQSTNYINVGKNDKMLSLTLFRESSHRSNCTLFTRKLTLISNFAVIKNSSFECFYKADKNFKELKIDTMYDQNYGVVYGDYKFVNENTKEYFSLESKIFSTLQNKTSKYFDIRANLKSILRFDNSNGEASVLINSNIKDFEKLHNKLKYQILKNDYSARNAFMEPFFNNFEIFVDYEGSTLFNKMNGKITIIKEKNTAKTEILFIKNNAAYNISMITIYDSLLCTQTSIKFATPVKTYTGGIVSNFTLLNTKLILHGTFDNNKLNTLELVMKSSAYNKMDLTLLINFVNLDFTPWRLNAKYDMASREKFVFLEGINRNGVIIKAALDMSYLNLEVNSINQVNLFKINGSHSFNNLRNIAVGYNVDISKDFLRFDIPAKIFYFFNTKQFNSSFKFNTFSHVNSAVLDINYHQDNMYSSLKFLKHFLDDLNFFLEIEEPFLKSIIIDIKSSKESDQHSVNVIKGSKSILDVIIGQSNRKMILKCNNSWKPFSIEYFFENLLNANGKLCWDLYHKNISQIGGRINVNGNVSIEVTLPTRVMSLESNYFSSRNLSSYFGQFSWHKNKKCFIKLLKLNDTVNDISILKYQAEIDTPIRLIQFSYKTEKDSQVIQKQKWEGSFKWNRDDNSKLHFQNYYHLGNFGSKVFLPILKQDIVLKVSINDQNSNSSNLKAELEYSNDDNKRITFEMHYDKVISNIFKSERRFVLKHPASRIEYHLQLRTLGSPEFTTGNITFSYMNYVLNRLEEIKSSLTIGHKKFSINGNIQTSKNYVQFSSYTKSGRNFQKVFLLTQLDKKEPLTFEGNYIFKRSGSFLSFFTNCGQSRSYQFFAGFPSKREITAYISHNIFGTEGIDGKFTLKLNSTQIIWLKINWKNNWLAQFKDTILEDYYDLRYVIKEIGQQLIDVVDDNIGQAILNDFLTFHNNMSFQMIKELDLLDKDYKHFKNYLRIGCQSNAFYCQDIINATKIILPNQDFELFSLVQKFLDFFSLLNKKLKDIKNYTALSLQNLYKDVYSKVEQSIKKLENVKQLKMRGKQIFQNGIYEARKSLKAMDVIIDKVRDSVNQYIDNTKNNCQEFLEPYLKLSDDFVIYIEQRLAILQMLVLDILDNVQHYILNLKESREILKFYIVYINWLEEFHISDILEPIADIIESVLDVIIKDSKRIFEDFWPYINSFSEALFGNYEELNKLFEVEQCREILNKVYSKTLWIWNYNNLTETMSNCLHKIISGFDDYLASLLTLDYDGNNFEDILDQSDYVIRSDIGLIEITQPIPFEWEAFDEMPKFNQVPLYDKLKNRFENLVKLERHHFTDLINTFKNYIGDSSNTLLSPATNNVGMIVGKSHYITFDKKYYNFAGECSYLLAGDLQTKSFSVVINYKSAITKSLSVITDEHNLEISSDFISLNNKYIDLPLVTESLIVTSENSKIVIDHSKGLKIVCNLEYDFCIIELSGWLFGKTGGLLGTLDNEKFTDMRLPDGDHTTDILQFVQSWHVGNCTDINHVNDTIRRNISPLTLTLYETLCAVFFSNINSPSANCFSMVDPKPFYEMCVNNMKQTVNSTMCSTVAAYKTQCDRSNVHFSMPELCVFCKHNIGLNEVIFDRNNPTSVDIVFIKGSEYFRYYNLSSLPNYINANLEKRGFMNNRFAVVGYDNVIGHPYVYTSQGQVWNDVNHTVNLFHRESDRNPRYKLSALDAVKYAANMEFRPGVTKQLILLQCDFNLEDENLNSLHSMFGEKDIVFHVLCINNTNLETEELLELDSQGHILNIQNGLNVQDSYIKSINATINVGISDQVTDIYSLLALSTNGTVLSLNTNLKSELDNIVSSWSHIISKTAYRSPCQKCKCVNNLDGIGLIKCKRCMSPIVKQLLNEYESNIMEFYSNQDSDEYI